MRDSTRDAFERDTLAALGMPREIVMRHRTPQFGHMLSDGYAAGYYSYLWANTLTADAREAFTEAKGPYDRNWSPTAETQPLRDRQHARPRRGDRAFRTHDPEDRGADARGNAASATAEHPKRCERSQFWMFFDFLSVLQRIHATNASLMSTIRACSVFSTSPQRK
jgi:hypothetical protein